MDTFLTISQMAAATGLSAHTLRYYERIGLLRSVARGASGHRHFSAGDQAWVGFLVRLRATGMPIRAMQRFAALREQGDGTAAERRAMLEAHLESTRAARAALEEAEQLLSAKIAHYRALEAPMTSLHSTTRKRHERTLPTRPGETG
ncbi:MAG: MerR family transcriptional regulator [Massilia sp.]